MRNNLLHWISGFLSNRFQRVRVERTLSDPLPVGSGVPQGSVLGPLLFLIYINDIPENISSNCRLYADDLKLFRIIHSFTDIEALQGDLKSLEAWSLRNGLSFNGSKTVFLSLQQTIPDLCLPSPYFLFNTNIKRVSEHRDLGIILNSTLDPHTHVLNIARRANSLLAVLKFNLPGQSLKLFNTLYSAFVRPLLESASCIWNPHHIGDINILENVQARASKIPYVLRGFSRSDRLTALNWKPLKDRRLYLDLVTLYKLLRTPGQTYFAYTASSIKTRGNSRKLHLPHSRKDTAKYSFFRRVITPWNTLPEDVVTAGSVNSFKTKLLLFMNTRHFNPDS